MGSLNAEKQPAQTLKPTVGLGGEVYKTNIIIEEEAEAYSISCMRDVGGYPHLGRCLYWASRPEDRLRISEFGSGCRE